MNHQFRSALQSLADTLKAVEVSAKHLPGVIRRHPVKPGSAIEGLIQIVIVRMKEIGEHAGKIQDALYRSQEPVEETIDRHNNHLGGVEE